MVLQRLADVRRGHAARMVAVRVGDGAGNAAVRIIQVDGANAPPC